MTTYRVGEAGATVFAEDGKPLARLRPGSVVVEGTIEMARLPAADRPHKRPLSDLLARPAFRKRLGGYQNKARHAGRDYEDKAGG